MSKKVLIITHVFPPAGSTGVYRVLKFTKYLNKFGWDPLILTSKSFAFGTKEDKTLMRDVPDNIQITRTYSFEPRKIYWKFRNRNKTETTNGLKEFSSPSGSQIKYKYIDISKVRNRLVNLIATPDHYIGWLPFALAKVPIIFKNNKDIKVIFSTSPPVTSHLVGYILKKITKRPWVADFRDPWTQNFGFNPDSKLRIKIEEFLEHQVLKAADRVIHTSITWKDQQFFKYPDIEPQKFKVITNGFDPEDFLNRDSGFPNKFTITYTGTIYSLLPMEYFIRAVELLIDRKNISEEDIQILFIGSIEPEKKGYFENLIRRGVVQILNRMNHDVCLNYMLNSHVLLYLVPRYYGESGYYTTKIYEYLYSQRPILALLAQGEPADLIRRAKAGTVVDPEDVGGIKNAIIDLYKRYREGNMWIDSDMLFINKFNRKLLTKQLADVLEELVK